MTVATGHSEDLDSADAIAEALDACAEALGDRVPSAGLLFAGIDHDHQALLDGVEARYPGLPLIGCTTHGEMASDGFAEDSVVLTLFHSDRVQFRAGVAEGVREEPKEAAQQAVAATRDGLREPARLCITVPEGLGIDASAVLEGLRSALEPSAVVCGGLAGDDARAEQTHQFCNGQVYTDAVPVLILAGPVRVATGVASGWTPMGPDYPTRVEGPVIREIGGESPREMWRRFYGVSEFDGYRNAVAVYPDDAGRSEEFYLCTPSHFEEDGSIVTFIPVAPGARLRFTDATRDDILSCANASAARARADYGDGEPDAALVFSCSGRHMLLGTRVSEEASLLREKIGTAVPVAGFYTYGEICPLPGSPTPFPHNCTFVTVLIGEEL